MVKLERPISCMALNERKLLNIEHLNITTIIKKTKYFKRIMQYESMIMAVDLQSVRKLINLSKWIPQNEFY